MRRDERGFTLVEVVMAVVIAGIIFPALIGACILGLRTLDDTNHKLAGSNDSLLIASYFTSDVQGASNLATGGTRAHVTPAVTVPTGTSSTVLALFYALRGTATLTSPPEAGGATLWNTSVGALTSAAAADAETLTDDNRNDTLARVATTPSATSSATHTVALRPTGLVSTFGAVSGGQANGTSVTLTEASTPVGTTGVLLAHITVATSAVNVDVPPTGWTEVSRVELSPTLSSLVYQTRAANGSWTWRLKPQAGNRDIAGGLVGFVNVSTSSPVLSSAASTNPCGGETPVLSIASTDRTAVSSTGYYFQTDGDEHQLVRRNCTGDGQQSSQVLARGLREVSPTTVSCTPAACDPLPASVALTLREAPLPHDSVGRSYVLSARTRTG